MKDPSATKQSKKQKMCAYCGQNPATTKDHVIPRCLFLRPLPNNMITVPCCETCNNDLSKDEDYVRDMLMADYRTHRHPVAKELLRDKVASSARQGSSDLSRALMSNGVPIRATTASGITLPGPYFKVPIETERWRRVMAMIFRGLYFHHFKQPLPPDYDIQVQEVSHEFLKSMLPEMARLGVAGPYTLGNDVVSYMYNWAQEDLASTSWHLVFYKSIIVSAFTAPQGYVEELQRLHPRAR